MLTRITMIRVPIVIKSLWINRRPGPPGRFSSRLQAPGRPHPAGPDTGPDAGPAADTDAGTDGTRIGTRIGASPRTAVGTDAGRAPLSP